MIDDNYVPKMCDLYRVTLSREEYKRDEMLGDLMALNRLKWMGRVLVFESTSA